MIFRVRWILVLLFPAALACSISTKGLSGSRDGSIVRDGSRADGGDSCVPATEVCNGIDDDCDGVIDEDCACTPSDTQPCGVDMGACVAGIQTCGADAVWGACMGAVGPTAEVCEGSVDEDCDGVVDNGCVCMDGATQVCPDGTDTGVCSRGMRTCAGGGWGACVDRVDPGTEVCEGTLDEDCDGMVDNGCMCTNGVTQSCTDASICGVGMQTCASGAWGMCTGPAPATDTCDGIDNNCDGIVDDGTVCDAAASAVDCTVVHASDGHAYWLCEPSSLPTWDEARMACEAIGYHLVQIETDAENMWLDMQVDAAYGNTKFWTGLTDSATEGSYVWPDGTPACDSGMQPGPPYCHWRSGKPNAEADKDCVFADTNRGSAEWEDDSCGQHYAFVCEAP